jgi:hypothetical protein
MEARSGTARDFAAQLRQQAQTWKAVIDATGMKLE